MQRYVSEVKSDINREIELEELRKLKATMQDAARTIEQSVTSQVNYIDCEVKQAGAQVQEQIESAQKQVESAVAPVSGMQLMPPVTPAPEAPPASNEDQLPPTPDAADSVARQATRER